jgi:hypothetical protein
MRLASEQSARTDPLESLAAKRPGSSRVTVDAGKTAQFRTLPVVIRIATPPSGAGSGSPASWETIFKSLWSRSTILRIAGVGLR